MIEIKSFFHETSSSLTYVVYDSESLDAILIDPVLDYNSENGEQFTDQVDLVDSFIQSENLQLHWVLETHAHADHLTGAQEFKARYPNAQTGISSQITIVQDTFGKILELGDQFNPNGSQFDHLFQDNESCKAGTMEFKVIATPGHTPSCVCYFIRDLLFTGDTLFMPDFGTGRCDFPNGSATDLYKSIKRIYELPESTRVFVGHDYQPGGRELIYETSIGDSKLNNKHLKADTTEAEFVKFRTERDAQLSEPKLLKPSIRHNIQAGRG